MDSGYFMDLESYRKNYNGRNLALRMIHIAEQCVQTGYYHTDLELDALRLAYDALKYGEDVGLFKIVTDMIDGRLGEAYLLDQSEEFNFKWNCAQALAKLGEKSYRAAAIGFIGVFRDVNKYEYSKVVSEDIIVYGLICAMATFDPPELHVGIFGEIIDPIGGVAQHLVGVITPYEIGHFLIEIIKKYFDGCFSACIRLLKEQKPRLLLDIYLSEHVEHLCLEVKDFLVVGYLKCFSSILLDEFTVGYSGERLIIDSGGIMVTEAEVKRLMREKKIEGRIDGLAGDKIFHFDEM